MEPLMRTADVARGLESRVPILAGVQPFADDSRELGRGSYGRVFAVKYREATYAAKEIHSNLVQGEQIVSMFLRECEQCSRLCHPNIVEFVGVYYPRDDPSNMHLPVMVMEMMAQNLTSFVDKQKNIPVHLKVSIINDVALGLYYLHSHTPPIIHRDLSPNNILLTKNNVAKIGDLGMAKVVQASGKKTTAPGTADFMPPEALGTNSEYGPPLDVFSFAGVILHTFTQQWPAPSNPKTIDPKTRKLVALSEVERRSKYLDLMTGEGAVLKPLIEKCLDDDPAERPSMVVVCEKIEPLMRSADVARGLESRVPILAGVQPLAGDSRELGRGSYGRVFAVKYREATYAAKEVHSYLMQGERIIRMFLRECEQCSRLCHPNIVEFVGVYYPRDDPSNMRLPVMVMEMMAQNLTSFVDKQKNIPVHHSLKVSIINDVALGLYYLHSHAPPIIHRDLSPNNILLTDNNVAKIGDLGMAKVVLAGGKKTTAPGTIDFMPPEALGTNSEYGLPVDVFSFAGIILHTFTRQWPTPSNPKTLDPKTKKLVALSEVERRLNYLDLMTDEGAVLKPLIEECLNDDPAERPSMVVVCKKIELLLPKSSLKTSPKHSPRTSPLMNERHNIASVALPKLVSISRAQASSPALAKRKPRSATINTFMPSLYQEKCKPQLAKHFRPGVLTMKDLSPRMSIIQRTLKEREKDFCSTREIKIYCCTWNVNGQPSSVTLDHLFNATEESKPETHNCLPDIYAIGFQELDLSVEALLLNDSSREGDWKDAVDSGIKYIDRAYYQVHAIRLVGIFLIVFAKNSLREYITDVEAETVPIGVMGVMGDKGGVAIRFNLHHSSMCFVNCQLAASMEDVDKRNQDYNMIMTKLHFGKGRDVYRIMNHDMVFWIGDLNYRLQTSSTMTSDMIRKCADNHQIKDLQKIDQLNKERMKQKVFTNFSEGPIDFRPSYKYDPGTDNWDSGEKHRAPAWCDRILWYGSDVKQLYYRSHMSYRLSDHKPVSALMSAQVRVVNTEKEKTVFEEIVWELDKSENDTLPQVQLSQAEFTFTDVKFQELQTQILFVENIGLRPVQVSFISKMKDQESCCKPWMSISPPSTVILPGERNFLKLKVMVDSDVAPLLTVGKEKIEDILVLHLEGGKDFFKIVISGNYLPSCFGLSLELLVHLHTFVREATPTKLAKMEKDLQTISLNQKKTQESALPSYIPKELWKLVDYLFSFGLGRENLFTDGGLKQEINDIRELLDTGGGKLWDNKGGLTGKFSVYSVAAALLTFLEALAKPVIPVQFHQRCMECSNNTILCKQILMQLPKVHLNTFVYVMAFLKEIINNSDINNTDPKLLASLFSLVILRSPQGKQSDKSKRTLSNEKKRKEAFLYQCLVNDVI